MEAGDFRRLIDALIWFRGNPDSQLYPREIPVRGLDSKWLERRLGSVSDFAALVLGKTASGKDLFAALGLKTPPSMVRLRPLGG